MYNDEFFKTFFNEANMYVAVLSNMKTLLTANQPLLEFAGTSMEEVQDLAYFELPWWQHSVEMQNQLVFSMEGAYFGETTRFSATHKSGKGEIHEIDFVLKPIFVDAETEYVIAMGYDITKLVATQKSLTMRERQITAFFNNFSDGCFFFMLQTPVAIVDKGEDFLRALFANQRIEEYNEVLLEILGISLIDEANLLPSLGIGDAEFINLWSTMLSEGKSQIDTTIPSRSNSEMRHLDISIACICNELSEFQGCFFIVRDTTQETRYLNEIQYLAKNDPLTGMRNRRSFFDEAHRLYSHSKLENKPFSVAIMDIDHFKRVNDNHGHDAGDLVLKTFAQMIVNAAESDAVIGRYGGEEFVVAASLPVEQMHKMLEGVRHFVEEHPIPVQDIELPITVSIGYSNANGDGLVLEDILKQADIALYESKNNGRNRTTLFIEEIHGQKAYDTLCACLNEISLLYRMKRFFTETFRKKGHYSVLYIRSDFLCELTIKEQERHISTLSMCINKCIRKNDLHGRYGETGFIILMPDITIHQVESKWSAILDYISVGFNGVLNSEVEINFSMVDSKMNFATSDAMLQHISKNMVRYR